MTYGDMAECFPRIVVKLQITEGGPPLEIARPRWWDDPRTEIIRYLEFQFLPTAAIDSQGAMPAGRSSKAGGSVRGTME
jgi:hypothetical protein